MDYEDLDSRGGAWLRGGGPQGDVVISSRVRLARNLAGFPFLTRASDDQKQEIVERIRAPLGGVDLDERRFYVDVAAADDVMGSFLVERHLISRELQHGRGPRGVAFGGDEVISVMVNEEDHLRIQAIRASLSLDEAYARAVRIDRLLEREVEFAASTQFGYLTACPTNVGTGMRASVMLHLPAMVQMKQIEKLFHAANQTGLTVRGFYGEGTMASGDLYQISNQVTLGCTEEQILKELQKILPTILEYERRCREELLSDRRRLRLEDRCQRALATLRAARILSTDEAMQHVSAVRLGLVSGVLGGGIDLARVNALFVLTQPAHVQKIHGRAAEPAERDVLRAQLVRRTLDA
jgi:protein arginine kinase